jgi:hypothetical protein
MLKKVVMLMSVVAVSTLFITESNAVKDNTDKEKNEINTPKKKKKLPSRKREREVNTPNQENQEINTPDAPTKKKGNPKDKRRFRKSTARHCKRNLNDHYGQYHEDDRDQFGSDATE